MLIFSVISFIFSMVGSLSPFNSDSGQYLIALHFYFRQISTPESSALPKTCQADL